jgi:hypothetical protein
MRGMVHRKSNTFDKTILKIFWTLMEWDDEQKINDAFMALANFRAYFEKRLALAHNLLETNAVEPASNSNLYGDFFLLLPW